MIPDAKAAWRSHNPGTYDYPSFAAGFRAAMFYMSNGVEATTDFLDDLERDVLGLMFYWSPNRDAADWICTFCNTRAASNVSCHIDHAEDCRGQKHLVSIAELRKTLDI